MIDRLSNISAGYAHTEIYAGITKTLVTKVNIYQANPHKLLKKDVVAVWDTGATCSVIDKKLAKEWNLDVVKYETFVTANGTTRAKVYYLTLELPNGGYFPNLQVSELKLASGFLIGMDVIKQGDFHISNDGTTVFTFRTPSHDVQDYELDELLIRPKLIVH